MSNIVYIATSIDGYIADRHGGLDWLETVPNPENADFGWSEFMNRIDAIVMGRNTFETVCGFACDWPYSKPVFVLSRSLQSVPNEYKDKAQLVKGALAEVLHEVHQAGHSQLYIDGGLTVHTFLKEDLIDEMIITTIPVLLGGGIALFRELPKTMEFAHVKTEVFLDAIVQSHYKRKR